MKKALLTFLSLFYLAGFCHGKSTNYFQFLKTLLHFCNTRIPSLLSGGKPLVNQALLGYLNVSLTNKNMCNAKQFD